MKILFISSGNARHVDLSPFIKAQGESLRSIGHEVDYYPIKGKGILGYLKNARPLQRAITDNVYDVLHAHYSLSGLVAYLAERRADKLRRDNMTTGQNQTKISGKPVIIVSLLGSDVNGGRYKRFLLRKISCLWDAVIVKSQEMKSKLGRIEINLLPNGVDLNQFCLLDKACCREDLSLQLDKKYILFAADPQRMVKNYPLTLAAYTELINSHPDLTTDNCELLTLGFTEHELIPKYINACDVLILTSLWEGSPNIIKEAMACNVPIVSTKVGDVPWLFGGMDGNYLADPDPEDVATKLAVALSFEGRTKGRDRLIELGLDSATVAKKLVEIYGRVISRQ